MNLEFKRLRETGCSEYAAIKIDPLVMRHVPLAGSGSRAGREGGMNTVSVRGRLWSMENSLAAAADTLKREMPIRSGSP